MEIYKSDKMVCKFMNVPECQRALKNVTLLVFNLIINTTNTGVYQMQTLDGNTRCLPLNNHEQRGNTLEREMKRELVRSPK